MPNGYGPAQRPFTKIMKQPFRYLRSLGHFSVIYVDDSFLLGETFSECHRNVYVTVKLLEMLGFTIHPGKSVLIPSQILVFLGFIISSLDKSVTVSQDKRDRIASLTSHL